MCTDHGVDWHQAADAADELLARLRVPLSKVLDPMDDDDFVKIAARLARQLEKKRRSLIGDDIHDAIATLDIEDWIDLTPAAQGALVDAVNVAIRVAEERVLPIVSEVIEAEFERVAIGAARSVNGTFELGIELSTDLVDDRVVKAASRQDIYFRDEIGRRSATFSQKGRDIIQDGLKQGLRSRDISSDLKKAATKAHLQRSEHYMRVVSSQAMNGSRVYGALKGLDAAGFDSYAFEAVVDERTTEVCRLMDGKVFRIAPALQKYDDIASNPDPEAVRDLKPWVNERTRADGRREMYTKDRAGLVTVIGIVDERGFGVADKIGAYSNVASLPTMEQLGLSYPPLHGLCRSTIVPA